MKNKRVGLLLSICFYLCFLIFPGESNLIHGDKLDIQGETKEIAKFTPGQKTKLKGPLPRPAFLPKASDAKTSGKTAVIEKSIRDSIGWKDTHWTGVLEKRAGKWLIVQMHFSFAADKIKAEVKAKLEAAKNGKE